MSEEKYNLKLTRPQLMVVKDALEEYFRVRLGQWDDFANSLASKNLNLSGPDSEEFLDKKDQILPLLENIGEILWVKGNNPQTQEQLIAQDVWQVIRYELQKALKEKGKWTGEEWEELSAPFHWSKEELPVLTVEREDSEKDLP